MILYTGVRLKAGDSSFRSEGHCELESRIICTL
jgi:hypothetical protein